MEGNRALKVRVVRKHVMPTRFSLSVHGTQGERLCWLAARLARSPCPYWSALVARVQAASPRRRLRW